MNKNQENDGINEAESICNEEVAVSVKQPSKVLPVVLPKRSQNSSTDMRTVIGSTPQCLDLLGHQEGNTRIG